MAIKLIGKECRVLFSKYNMTLVCVGAPWGSCPKQRNQCEFDYECLREVVQMAVILRSKTCHVSYNYRNGKDTLPELICGIGDRKLCPKERNKGCFEYACIKDVRVTV